MPFNETKRCLPSETEANILREIVKAQNGQELSLNDQRTISRIIDEIMRNHPRERDSVAKSIAQTWSFLQYSHLCILVHRFRWNPGAELGVWSYFQSNPALCNRDTHGEPRGAAALSEEYFKDYVQRIAKGGSLTTKFPRMDQWLKKWFTEGDMTTCEQQYQRWKKEEHHEQLWNQSNMICALWCPTKIWNSSRQEWLDDRAKPRNENAKSWEERPAKEPQVGKSAQAEKPGRVGGSRPVTPLGQTPQHSRVNSLGTTSHETTQQRA